MVGLPHLNLVGLQVKPSNSKLVITKMVLGILELQTCLSFTALQPVPHQCEYGTELVYKRGKWYACFPQYIEPVNTGNYRVIALDPGVRTFLTGYDGENIL